MPNFKKKFNKKILSDKNEIYHTESLSDKNTIYDNESLSDKKIIYDKETLSEKETSSDKEYKKKLKYYNKVKDALNNNTEYVKENIRSKPIVIFKKKCVYCEFKKMPFDIVESHILCNNYKNNIDYKTSFYPKIEDIRCPLYYNDMIVNKQNNIITNKQNNIFRMESLLSNDLLNELNL